MHCGNSELDGGLKTTDLRPIGCQNGSKDLRSGFEEEADNQLHDLRTFAASQPVWEITGEYIERVSGSGLKERHEFERTMLDASRYEFDHLLFCKFDRFSREGISTTLRYLENLNGWGAGRRTYQEPWLDTGNPMVTGIVLSVTAAMAQQERQTLIARTLSGLRTAKRNGKILGRTRRAIDWERVNARVAKGGSVRSVALSLEVSHSLLLKGLS